MQNIWKLKFKNPVLIRPKLNLRGKLENIEVPVCFINASLQLLKASQTIVSYLKNPKHFSNYQYKSYLGPANRGIFNEMNTP